MKKIKLTPKKIVKLVEKQLEIPDLGDKNRSRNMVQARLIYYKLAKRFCRYASLAMIGNAVKRDHASVIYGLRKYDQEAKYDPYMNDVYDALYNELDPVAKTLRRSTYGDMTIEKLIERLTNLENKLNKLELA